jgi:hypothetical protein
MVLVSSTAVLVCRANLTGKVDGFASVIAATRADCLGGLVFHVDATGVAVEFAVVAGPPVGSFVCVTAFAEFGTMQEGVEGFGGLDESTVEEKCLEGI